MAERRVSVGSALFLAGSLLVAVLAACGSERSSGFGASTDPNATSSGSPGFGGSQEGEIASLSVEPASATLVVENNTPATQPFKLVAHFADGKSGEVAGDWTSTNLPLGNVASNGVYTANGTLGGAVTLSATYKGKKADAQLAVKLHILENPSNLPAETIAALKAATAPDVVQWTYPYDGTVFPRGLAGPALMWNNGGPNDAYYVHVTSATFDLESFQVVPAPAKYELAPGTWLKFVDSTAGAANLHVARFDGSVGRVVVDHKWTISPASMRGTIYYWANNVGRVMRIKPGASAPDDFSAGTFGSLPDSPCTMTCHTVSADGSTLVSGGDTLGGSYDLLKNAPIYDLGGLPATPQKRFWSNGALSPNGKYFVPNGMPDNLGAGPGGEGLWRTADGVRVPGSNLDNFYVGMPAFAPDGSKIAYVVPKGVGEGALSTVPFDLANGTANAGAANTLVLQGNGSTIVWPSVAPDGNWIVYERGVLDTRAGNGDLYLASAINPNQEVRLAKLNGDGYPFAAGSRDLSFNFEPTFAPVASGGYYWVVFTSRRTYGNLLTGGKDAVKQLWVAAIDMNPAPGVDPSHAAFRLPGQDIGSINMRGFWALDPCKGDGQGCESGTECCGGFCDGTGSGDAKVCKSAAACAHDGDKCKATSECCNAASGTSCINGVCTEPGPK